MVCFCAIYLEPYLQPSGLGDKRPLGLTSTLVTIAPKTCGAFPSHSLSMTHLGMTLFGFGLFLQQFRTTSVWAKSPAQGGLRVLSCHVLRNPNRFPVIAQQCLSTALNRALKLQNFSSVWNPDSNAKSVCPEFYQPFSPSTASLSCIIPST